MRYRPPPTRLAELLLSVLLSSFKLVPLCKFRRRRRQSSCC